MEHYYRVKTGPRTSIMVRLDPRELNRGRRELITIWPVWPEIEPPGTAYNERIDGPYCAETTSTGLTKATDDRRETHDSINDAKQSIARYGGQATMEFRPIDDEPTGAGA